MAAGRNPFEHLIPDASDDSASYKAAGAKAAKKFNVASMIDLNEGKQNTKNASSAQNPFAHLIPESTPNASQEPTEQPKPGLLDPIRGLMSASPFGESAPFMRPTGLGDVAKRVLPKAVEDAVGQGKKWLGSASEHLMPTLEHIAKNPMQAGGEAVSGVTSLIDQLLNIPRNAPAISEHLGLTAPGSGDISQKLPKFDISQFVPQPKTDEGKFIKETFEDLPILLPAAKVIGKAGKAGTKAAWSGFKGEDPLKATAASELEKKVLAHKSELEAVNKAYEGNKEAAQEAKSAAKQVPEVATGDPDSMIREQTIAGLKTGDLNTHIQDIEKALDENKPVTPLDNEALAAKNQLEQTEARHGEVGKTNEAIESQLASTVNANANHTLHAGRGVRQKLNENKEEITNEYNKHYANAEKQKAILPKEESQKFKTLMGEFYKLWEEDKHYTEEGDKLGQQIKDLTKDETVSGAKMIDIYKSVNGYIRDAYKKAYELGTNKADQSKWLDRAEALEEKQGKIRDSLKTAIGEDSFNALQKTDARWRDEVAALYENPMYWKAVRGKRLPDNIMKSLSDDSRGMDILRNIVYSDPEILKNVIGQRYAASPKAFHEKAPTELMQSYLQNHPEINRLVNAKSANEATLAQESQNLKAHGENYKARKAEADERNTQLKEYEKNRESLQKQRDEAIKKRDMLTNKIDILEKHKNEVQAKLKAEKKSLKLKTELGRKLDAMNAELKELNKQRVQSEGIVRQAIRLGYRAIKKYGAKAIRGSM